MAIVRTGVSSAMASATAATTCALPTGCAAGDVAVLCIETANEGLGTNPGALGWTVLTGSTATATGTAAAAGATRLAVLWKVLTSGDITTGSVSISDTGDHQNAVMATYSGVDTTTPITWNSGSGDVGTPATTSVSLSSVTRGSASSVCLGIIATDRDNATASTNASPSWTGVGAPASNSFIANFSSITGQGGGLILNEGTGGAAGAAAFSCSITSSIWVGRVIVLNPSADVTLALTGQGLTVAQGSVAPSTSLALTGQSLPAALGTVTVSSSDVTVAITGQSLSVARGTIAAATSRALSGQALSVARGSLVAGNSLALAGQSLAASRGVVSVAATDVTVALTGLAVSIARGSLSPQLSAALAGSALTLGLGDLTAPVAEETTAGRPLGWIAAERSGSWTAATYTQGAVWTAQSKIADWTPGTYTGGSAWTKKQSGNSTW